MIKNGNTTIIENNKLKLENPKLHNVITIFFSNSKLNCQAFRGALLGLRTRRKEQ